MAFKYFTILAVLLFHFYETEAHGRLMDPVNRSSVWRISKFNEFKPHKNYEDNELFCGGRTVQHQQNGGKCGICGDNYRKPQPRPNENGGKFGQGVIVQEYQSGSTIVATVDLTANHYGHFEFALCPLKFEKELETEECFDAHKLELAEGGYKYPITTKRSGKYFVKLNLPKGLTCKNCVFRWQYVAGNNPNRSPQETFRNCADITIE